MSLVTVYKFRKYDIATDENRVSRRWATADAIVRVGGEALLQTATPVDASVLGVDIDGMTRRDFNPAAARSDFQRQVNV